MSRTPQFPAVTLGSFSGVNVQTVNARSLHSFLMIGKDFSNWIKDRVEQYGFMENVDFVVFASFGVNYEVHILHEQYGFMENVDFVVYAETGENPRGGRPTKEYALSLDMAKELSMVERNEQGKRARQYFIECERRAKDPAAALNDPAMLRHLLLENVEKVLHLEADIREMEPVVAAYEHLTRSDGTMCVSDAAKALAMRPKELFSWMNAKRWIYRRAGNSHWIGYQDKIQSGLLDHRVEEVTRADGSSKITEQVRVTAKGLAALAKVIAPTSGMAA